MTVTCIVCGKERISYGKNPKFCSRECFFIDRTGEVVSGETFGNLTVIQEAKPHLRPHAKNGNIVKERMVECECVCGNIITTQLAHLRNGSSKSCGCSRETHNLSGHHLYSIWADVKKRCFNKNHVAFHRYGGRGITICERWKDFQNFYDDLILGYKKGLTLDRINNDGNYEPNNCRWATVKNQCNNTCNTIRVEYNGEIYPLTIICEKLGVNYMTIRNRIKTLGLTFTEAINRPKYLSQKTIEKQQK